MITDLTLQPLGEGGTLLPLLSCRNCIQTLTPVPRGELHRTVNGELVHTGLPGHTKYRSVIKGDDQVPPALEHVWKGAVFQVGCLVLLTQRLNGGRDVELSRLPVEGSVSVADQVGVPLEIREMSVRLPQEGISGFISYRPLLEMSVTDFKVTTDEWGMTTGWTLELVEL